MQTGFFDSLARFVVAYSRASGGRGDQPYNLAKGRALGFPPHQSAFHSVKSVIISLNQWFIAPIAPTPPTQGGRPCLSRNAGFQPADHRRVCIEKRRGNRVP